MARIDPLLSIEMFMKNMDKKNPRNIHPYSLDCETNSWISMSYGNHSNHPTYLSLVAIELCKGTDLSCLSDIIVTLDGNVATKISFDILYKISDVLYDEDNVYITFRKNVFPIYNLILSVYTDMSYVLRTHDKSHKITYKLHTIKEYIKIPRNPTNLSIFNMDNNPVKRINYFEEIYTDYSNMYDISKQIYLLGFLIETTRLKSLDVLVDKSVPIIKYNQYILEKCVVKKFLWTRKKSEVFNMIMDCILPTEIINHIESFISDTYLYYIPIHIDNKMLDPRGNYVNLTKDKSMHISINEPKFSKICFISWNCIEYRCGTARLYYTKGLYV